MRIALLLLTKTTICWRTSIPINFSSFPLRRKSLCRARYDRGCFGSGGSRRFADFCAQRRVPPGGFYGGRHALSRHRGSPGREGRRRILPAIRRALSDFQGTLVDAAGRSIPVALLIFLLSLPAIVYLARSISKPLVRLSDEAELIRRSNSTIIKMQFRVPEVNTLIRSMSGMKSSPRRIGLPKALAEAIRHVGILRGLASLIIEANGTVDKFIGDAIFAFWNAPLAVTRHEHRPA